MKTLVVGGTGGIGGYVALALQREAHAVTLAARHRAKPNTPVANMPIILGNYADGDFTKDHDHTGLGGGLTADLGEGVLSQAGIEDSVRDLIANLV